MIRKILLLALCAIGVNFVFAQSRTIKVLQLNVWQEGTQVKGGFGGIVDEIKHMQPDIVTLSEVRNYNKVFFTQKLMDTLKASGMHYYSFYSDGAGILAKYPLHDTTTIFKGKGEIYKAVATIHGKEIAIYSAHLDYLNYAVYLPRGYSGTTWKKLEKPELDVAKVLEDNLASQRDEAILAFIDYAKVDIEKNRIVFLGGDFNEASHLDWTAKTKDFFDHNGLIVPWQNSIALYQNGFKDSYRELYKDPLKYPGFTFPADNKMVPVNKLAWAPEVDERERIDFIYYGCKGNLLKLKDSKVVGPRGSIVRNQRVEETSKDQFILPQSVWPSDHKGVLSVFELKK